jgi:AraC family transcriptional regulator
VCDWPDFDTEPYAGLDTADFVRRSYCSWDEAGWRSMLVQCFAHARRVGSLSLPGVSDLHLVLYVAGDAVMRVHSGGKPVRRHRIPGSLELMVRARRPSGVTIPSRSPPTAPASPPPATTKP